MAVGDGVKWKVATSRHKAPPDFASNMVEVRSVLILDARKLPGVGPTIALPTAEEYDASWKDVTE